MNRDMTAFELLKSASDVWRFLKKQGGLNTKVYDSELEEELKCNLLIPSSSTLEKGLETISTEDFVVAFFQAVQPYAVMMSDLVAMFEEAGAKQTNKNINISFDFGKAIPELKFDLSHFKNWVETWQHVLGTYLTSEWNDNTIWELLSVLRENDEAIANPILNKWLDQYLQQGVWSEVHLPVPRSGNSDLDKTLAKVWKVWSEVVLESAKYGRERSMLRNINSLEFDKLPENLQRDRFRDRIRWSPRFLAKIDQDNWSAGLAKGVYIKAEKISRLEPQEKLKEATKLRDEIESVFSKVPTVEVEGEILAQDLQEFLQLPLWRYRHELYSIWISTQILNSLEGHSIRVHHVDGKLNFSFSGTHFATVDDVEPRLHIWTELRSPLEDPVGKCRTKAIQPDYSLVIDPITSPESSVVVVECKQYKRGSSKNFSDALSDYARGRPNAHVILVNYGTANQDILDRVHPAVRHRTSLISLMRPGSISSQNEFKGLVKDLLSLEKT
jgi:hypothetical protein